jgi:hypothetical protein
MAATREITSFTLGLERHRFDYTYGDNEFFTWAWKLVATSTTGQELAKVTVACDGEGLEMALEALVSKRGTRC